MSRFHRSAARSLSSFLAFVIDVMGDGLRFLRLAICSHSTLSAEILFLRQVQTHRLDDSARASLVFWSRLFDWKDALVIVKPETLIGWHRKGFKLFWKWKSRVGRPRLPEDIRKLIVRMASEKPHLGTGSGGSRAGSETRDPGLSAHRASLSDYSIAGLQDVCTVERKDRRISRTWCTPALPTALPFSSDSGSWLGIHIGCW